MAKKQINVCFHCDPFIASPNHLPEKVGEFLFGLSLIFKPIDKLVQRFPSISPFLIQSLIKVFLRIRLMSEIPVAYDDQNLHNRSIIIAREFKKRNIPVKSIRFLNLATNFYSINLSGKRKFFEGLPHLVPGGLNLIEFDDKGLLKKILKNSDIPYPEGQVFKNPAKAVDYATNKLGFPVVVKPRSGSLSKHTTCNIRTEKALKEAITIVKIISPEFIVEKHYNGDVNRVTLVGGAVIASCLRERPNVIGDGKKTVEQLVSEKNENPLRGARHQKNFTLHKITITERSIYILKKQGLVLKSIPAKGRKVYLHDKVILACGADIHDNTNLVHPSNIDLFKKVAKLCQAPVIGIDFIARDITVPYHRQKCAILEVNSQPYIDMHHFPVTGQARNVAGKILNHYLSNLKG